jgi:aminopeptidase N
VGRIPSYVAVDPAFTERDALDALPAITRFYESIYGPYPFNATGAVVDDAPDVGYALETQTKPVYDEMPDEGTIAHEQSHMWLGNSVTLTQWPDIWLHEGFATWSEWIWSEHSGGATAQQIFEQLYAIPAANLGFWTPPPAAPGSPVFLFDGTIYARGAMTLQALRQKVGDFAYFRIMRTWVSENRDGNVSTPQFIALAEQIAQQQLDTFFDVWLFRPEKPAAW